MSEAKKYTADAVPLPLGNPIAGRPASDRLPLPFSRPWGYPPDAEIVLPPDEPQKPQPYRPPEGYAAVAQGWGFMQHPVKTSAACIQTAFSRIQAQTPLRVLSPPALSASGCVHAATAGMAELAGCMAETVQPPAALAGDGSVSVSAAPPLQDCDSVVYSADAVLANHGQDQGAAGNAPGLRQCAAAAAGAQQAVEGSLAAALPAAQDLAACIRPQAEPAQPVPCEWYEIPLEPEADNAEKTYICGIRPPSNRMALRFRRPKIAHSAQSIPLPFACFDSAETPILQGYIMQNTVSASFDNGQPLGLFSASFTCDTGGYCWQGSVTVSPDDFVKLDMDGRAKGKEAVITCQINGDTFVIAAEEYSDNRQFGQKSYTVSGRSLTAYLGDDYADKADGTYRQPVYAAQIANEQLKNSGFAVDNWAAADWLIPANVYSLTDKSPMAVIQELAAAAGAFVCSDTAKPALRVRPKWPKAAWEIDNAEADVSVPSSVVFKISGQKTVSERANGVFVWATHNAGAAADVYRKGSDREPRASAVSGALYTDQPVLLAAGIAALSATGTHKKETVTLPVSDKYAVPLAELGQIWQINEPTGAFKGVVTGVTLEVGIDNDAPTVTQSVVIDRYLDD